MPNSRGGFHNWPQAFWLMTFPPSSLPQILQHQFLSRIRITEENFTRSGERLQSSHSVASGHRQAMGAQSHVLYRPTGAVAPRLSPREQRSPQTPPSPRRTALCSVDKVCWQTGAQGHTQTQALMESDQSFQVKDPSVHWGRGGCRGAWVEAAVTGAVVGPSPV